MIKRKMFMRKISIILICKKIGLVRLAQHKTKLPLSNLHSNPIVMLIIGKVKHQIFNSDLHQQMLGF